MMPYWLGGAGRCVRIEGAGDRQAPPIGARQLDPVGCAATGDLTGPLSILKAPRTVLATEAPSVVALVQSVHLVRMGAN